MSEGRDPGALRIGDKERNAVAELLREAAGEGRLDLDELDERLEATYAARTYADLVPLTADLPVAGPGHPGLAVPGPLPVPAIPHGRPAPARVTASHSVSFAMMAETRRQGAWAPGDSHQAVAVMGSVVLDLRQAQLAPGRETVITANAIMGSVEVVVDAWTEVVVSGLGIMGDFSEMRPKVESQVGPGSPVVRVRGVALMGSVSVRRRGEPHDRRSLLRD
jgi:hypothetical protein